MIHGPQQRAPPPSSDKSPRGTRDTRSLQGLLAAPSPSSSTTSLLSILFHLENSLPLTTLAPLIPTLGASIAFP